MLRLRSGGAVRMMGAARRLMSAQASMHGDYLRLTKDGETSDFHYFWLLHNCGCTKRCKHPKTLERVLDVPEIPLDVVPRNVEVSGDVVHVSWPGNHESEYDVEWLLKHAYATNRALPVPPSNDVSQLEVDYEARESDAMYAQALLERFTMFGAVVVRNRGLDTEAIIEDFGGGVWESHFGRIEDLRTDNTTNRNTDQLGYTNAGVAPHTDMPFVEEPPSMQILHGMQAAERGGESYLVDSRAAANYLRKINPWAFDMLRTVPVKFHRRQRDFEAITSFPLIEARGDYVVSCRYSYFTMAPFKVPFEWMRLWYEAYTAFGNIIRNPANQRRFLLNAGDFVLYSNKTMVHARESFEGPRWVRGIYMQEEPLLESLRKSSLKD